MECPKCHRTNPETVQFCLGCHTPLRYICPACKHVQLQGGQCEKCGVDFAKFLAMMQFQMKSEADQARQRLKNRSAIIKQIFLLPITGGLSLLKYFRARLRGE
jgi:Double zinc ribbon